MEHCGASREVAAGNMDTTELEGHQSALPQNFLTTGWPNQEGGHYITSIPRLKLPKAPCSSGTTGYPVSVLPFCLLRAPFRPWPSCSS